MRRRIRQAATAMAVGAVLTLVFLAYAQPSLMQHLADQLWACF